MTNDFRDTKNTCTDNNDQTQMPSMVANDADRRAHVAKWIAKRHKAAAATLGSAMLFVPAMANAQADTGDIVNAADIAGVRSAEILEDGSARLVLDGGRILRIASQDFVAGASGEILIEGQVLEIVTEAAAGAAAGGGISGGALAAGAGVAGAAAIAADDGGGSGSAPSAPETLNRGDFLSGTITSASTDIVAEGASTIVFTIGDDEQAPVAVDADGNWTLPTFTDGEADALPQGEVEVSWTSFDGDGEEVDSGSETVIIDTIPPSIAIDGPIAGDDVINSAEQGEALTISGTTDAEDGQEVTVTMNGEEYTATAEDGAWSVDVPAADLAGLGDGDTITVTADVEDAAGNAATQASDSVDTDFSAEISIDAIADLNAAARLDDFDITGTSTGVEAGRTVTVSFNGNDYTGDVQADGSWTVTVPQADMAAIGDEVTEVAVSAEVDDAAGNGASATQDVTADFSEPSIAIADPADGDTIGIEVQEAGELTISGTTGNVSDGQAVTLEIRDGAGAVVLSATPAVAGGSWTHTFDDISGLADMTDYTISAEVSDAGLTASTSADVSVDYKPIVALDDLGDDEGALILEDLDPSDAEISGTTIGVEDGQDVTVRIIDGAGTELLNDTAPVTANAWALAVPAAVVDGLEAGADYTVTANVSNAAGRAADEASETVTGYAEAPNYLIAGGADGTELSMQIFMDPRFDLPADRGVSLGEEVSFDTGVLTYLADPAPTYTTGLTGITNATDADSGEVTFGSIGFLPAEFAPGQDPLVEFAMDVADADSVAQIDVETSGGGGYSSFIGTDADDVIAANSVDSVVQGRGGDDSIDLSAAGANSVIFEASSTANGVDTVTGFSTGGALTDRMGFAGVNHDDLRGDGTVVESLADGGTLGADTGLVVFTTAMADLSDDAVRTALDGLSGPEDGDILYFLASDGTDAQLYEVQVEAGGATVAEMARFEGLGDISGIGADNILGFEAAGAAT